MRGIGLIIIKKLLCCDAVLILALALVAGAAPDAAGAGRTVRVGVYQNEPKIFLNKAGEASGIFIELLKQIAVHEGWTIAYTSCEWEDCLAALKTGKIDLMPDVAYSEERDAKFDFHNTPIIESWSQVYASPKSQINILSDLNGKRVAVLDGSIQEKVFQQLMSGFGYKVTLVPASSFSEAFALARDGFADAAISNHLFGNYFQQKNGLAQTTIYFNPSKLYYAAAQGRNADLLQAIDRYLDQWIPQRGSPYYATLGHWEGKPAYRLPPYTGWVVGGLVGLLIFSAAMIALLRHQVGVRTRHLEQAGAELRESEERFRALTTASSDVIYRTSPDWSEMRHLDGKNFIANTLEPSQTWLDKYIHSKDQKRVITAIQHAIRTKSVFELEHQILRADGSMGWAFSRAIPILDANSEIIEWFGATSDITDRKRAEEEVHKLNAELEQRVAERTRELAAAKDRAESADRLKSAFLATMSHELRTPLNSIIGFTGVLLQGLAGQLNAEQNKQMGMVRDSARHLLALINDVLDVSKIEAGQLEIKRALFDMHFAIEEAMKLVMPQAQKKGLSLAAAINSNVGEIVSDQRRVEQILINLLNNSVKFTERGEVRLECLARDGFIETSVRDTGVGIRTEDMGKLFAPFRQIETGLNRRYEGTGLGLSICKNLVELLGGEIRVESEWGNGSVFTFTLPLAQASEVLKTSEARGSA